MSRYRALPSSFRPRSTTRFSRHLTAAVLAGGVLTAQVAAAQTAKPLHPPPLVAGQAAFDRATAAWAKGDYDVAEPLYAEAIEKGGLLPSDVLDAYVHLGATRAVLGKKAGALTAFKTAALLDAHFIVPPEAGKRATTVADQARRLEAKVSPLTFHAEIPTDIAAGDPARVDVTLDASHAAWPGSRIGIRAYDPAREGAAGEHATTVRAAKAVHFDLPKELSLPSTTLRVRVDWLDVHANRLATAEEQIHVQSQVTAGAPLPIVATSVGPVNEATTEGAPVRHEDHDVHGKSGFWHTAWPYIIGGAAIAAGGVALYFAARPGNDVNVTGAHVVTN